MSKLKLNTAAGGSITLEASNTSAAGTHTLLPDGDPAGASLVGYDGQTVQDVLDGAKSLQDYTALRAYTGRATQVKITSTDIAGTVWMDNSDTTSADDGLYVFVDALDRRWKRMRQFDDMGSNISATTSMLQTGPMIANVTNKLRITNSPADAAYNTAVLQDVLAGLPSGAEIEFPARGYAHINGGLEITSPGLSMRGRNSGSAYDSFWLKSASSTQDVFLVKSYGFHAEGVVVAGQSNPSNGFGNDVSNDCFSFELPGPDADAVFTNCGILFFRDCITVKNAAARNIKARGSLFSGSSRAFSYTHASLDYVARDFELYDNRYHGIGLAEHPRSAIVYVEPASNVRTLTIQGGMADFSVEVFRGYASGSEIRGLIAKGCERGYASLNATGHTAETAVQLGMSIENARYYGKDSRLTSRAQHALQLEGGTSGFYSIDGFTSYGSGGHGIYVASNYAQIRNTEIMNASQYADNTYSGYYIASNAAGVEFGGSNAYKQDIMYVAANKAAWSVYNGGTDTIFKSSVLAHNTIGKEYYIDPLKKSFGPDPKAFGRFRRESLGSSAPTSGTWVYGDIVYHQSPLAAGFIGWICVVGGTPGTWKTFGAISA